MAASTVDEKQMKKFDALSANWWNLNTLEALRQGNAFMFKYVTRIASERNLVKDVQVLDVGCGGGLLVEPLALYGFCVLGIDVNRNMIEMAEKHAQLNPSLQNLTYKLESIEDHAVSNPEKYDIIILNFVLTHVKNHEILLNNCVKALKPGGLLFISSAAKTYRAWLTICILAERYYRYIPKNAHNWHNFICAKEVDVILRKNQCVVNECNGFSYDISKNDWYWHDNVDVGYYTVLATKQ